MEGKQLQEMIDHGVKKYFDEKEARESAKAEKEAKNKKAQSFQKNLFTILTGGMALYLIWMCYKFVSKF